MSSTAFALLVLLCCPAICMCSEARQPTPFKPAMFGTGMDSFPAQLQCPTRKTTQEDAVVFCRTRVMTSGRSRQSDCFAYAPNMNAYTSEAKRATDRSRFEPAAVNRETVEVWFTFRVSYSWDGDVCNFAAIPNWGFDQGATTLEHVAPQEIVSHGRGWIDDIEFSAKKGSPTSSADRVASQSGSFSVGGSRSRPVYISVLVNGKGVPTEPRIEANLSSKEWKVEVPPAASQQPRFIPGFFKNEPVEMRYFTVLFAN